MILFQVILSKSHELLEEEILELVYSIAVTDFPKFQTQFLPQFVGNITQLTDAQKFSVITEYQLHEVMLFKTSCIIEKLCNVHVPEQMICTNDL